MTSEMIVAIGLEAIGQGAGAEDRAAWQVQVGVTRVGAGGRVLPRCRNGRMTTPDDLVVSTVEPQQLVPLRSPARKKAPRARAIAFLTVAVVAVRDVAAYGRRSLLTIVRAIWRALVAPRRTVPDAARQAWYSARDMGGSSGYSRTSPRRKLACHDRTRCWTTAANNSSPAASEGTCSVANMQVHLQPESSDLTYWNGRFFLWCLSRRPAWAMSKDLRGWARGIRPTASA